MREAEVTFQVCASHLFCVRALREPRWLRHACCRPHWGWCCWCPGRSLPVWLTSLPAVMRLMLRHALPHRLGKGSSGKGMNWGEMGLTLYVIRKLGCMKGFWGGGGCQTSGCSHQVCTQAAVVRGTPVYSAAPGVASSPARPAGRLWSLPPTDAPSVASCTKHKHRSHEQRCHFATCHREVNTGEHVVLLYIHSHHGEWIMMDRISISSVR